MGEVKGLVHKRGKIFVRGLSPDKPIVFTVEVISADDDFVTVIDRDNKQRIINSKDIIQFEVEE